jgi:hypothetical protein
MSENLPATEDDYVEDYMAPIEQLLPEEARQAAPAAEPEKPAKLTKVSLQTLMEDTREKSLAMPISRDNIGFKLLQKIGYTEGEGLGKEGKGVVQPIAIQKRTNTDMSGVGILEKKERMQVAIKTMKDGKKTMTETLEKDFVQNRIHQRNRTKMLQDLRGAQKIMYELDEAAGVSVHRLTATVHQRYADSACGASHGTTMVVPPPRSQPDRDARSEMGLYSFSHALCDKMYDKYSGADTIDTALEDVDADGSSGDEAVPVVRSAGSGNRRFGHRRVDSTEVEEATVNEDEEEDVTLEECLTYLRDTYSYCYYCGARYDDAADLQASCPGLTEDDH